ncbi:MAG: hypothetical protein ABSF88_08620 [Candidatus Aminicenantales bacterium]
MNLKKIGVLLLSFVIVAAVASAGTKEFSLGKFYLTPQIGFSSWGGSIPFGANAEYALNENIGIGGTVMAQFWSETGWSESLVSIAAEANYHFIKLNAEKIDLYVGAGIGYSVVSFSYSSGISTGFSGSSGLNLQPLIGARYYFSPKMAVSLRLVGSLIGDYTGIGATAGVTFILN